MKLYQKLARKIETYDRALSNGHAQIVERIEKEIDALLEKYFPSGSGFDAGCTLDPKSTGEKLIVHAPYHPMNEHGYYMAWIEYKITVTPSLAWGFNMKITPNRKTDLNLEYIQDIFSDVLETEVQL